MVAFAARQRRGGLLRWSCSGRRWPRSGCGSACTPARSSCATKATTSARPSTAPRGCATWPTGARPCSPASTEALVVDRLPADAWLTDLGTHPLRDLPRPERVVQLCHPDLVNEFPPLRVSDKPLPPSIFRCSSPASWAATRRSPRCGELLAENRLVTLTGAGGAGKTRLAVQIAAQLAGEFGRRGVVCGSGADHRSRRGADRGGPRTGAARSAGPLHDGHPAAVCRATGRCWWCWTTASTCSTRVPS